MPDTQVFPILLANIKQKRGKNHGLHSLQHTRHSRYWRHCYYTGWNCHSQDRGLKPEYEFTTHSLPVDNLAWNAWASAGLYLLFLIVKPTADMWHNAAPCCRSDCLA